MWVKVIVEALGRGDGPSGVTVGRTGLSVVGIIRAEVRVMGWPERRAFVLIRGCVGTIRVLAVVPEVVLVAQVIGVGQVLRAAVAVIATIAQRVVQVEDRFVLVVVDHHPTDDAVHLGPGSPLHLWAGDRALLACDRRMRHIKATWRRR